MVEVQWLERCVIIVEKDEEFACRKTENGKSPNQIGI
jgi:hypothetical protein